MRSRRACGWPKSWFPRTPTLAAKGSAQPDDPQKVAAAKAKADDIEAKLHAGGDFSQLAQSPSATVQRLPRAAIWASSAAEHLAKVLEDKTFALQGRAVHRADSHQAGLRHSQGGGAHPRRRPGVQGR